MGKISTYVFYFLLANVFTQGLFGYGFGLVLLNVLGWGYGGDLWGDCVFVICARSYWVSLSWRRVTEINTWIQRNILFSWYFIRHFPLAGLSKTFWQIPNYILILFIWEIFNNTLTLFILELFIHWWCVWELWVCIFLPPVKNKFFPRMW